MEQHTGAAIGASSQTLSSTPSLRHCCVFHLEFGTEAQLAHYVGMEPHAKRTYLAAALREPEIRRACRAVDRIITAGDALDHMSPTTLEVVRDYCAEQTKGTRGTFSEFRHAWVQLVVDHLNDARTLERRLYYGITGRGVPGLEEHQLPSNRPEAEATTKYEDENGNNEHRSSAKSRAGRKRS